MPVGKKDLTPGDVAHVLPTIVATPAPKYMIELDGQQYPIKLQGYSHQGIPSIREGVTTAGDPSESLFDHTGTWWRHRLDWTSGAGQRVGDFSDGARDGQYRLSAGIDPWTLQQLTLCPATVNKQLGTLATPMCAAPGGYLFRWNVATGQLERQSSPGVYGVWTVTTGAVWAYGTVGMCTDGLDVYIYNNTRVFRVNVVSNTAAAIGPAAPGANYTAIGVVGNRVLAARTNVLVETLAASETVISTLPTTFYWNTIIGVGSLIYVGGNTAQNADYLGTQAQMFTLATTSTGTLVLGPIAAPFGVGEYLCGAVSHAGLVMIQTQTGFRCAQPAGDGTLTYGPLFGLQQFPATAEFSRIVPPIAADGIVWGLVDINRLVLKSTQTDYQFVRVDLTLFTDALVPAWAPSFIAPADGVYNQSVQAMVTFGSRTYPIVSSSNLVTATQCKIFQADAAGVLGPVTTYAASGSISSGRLYFGTIEQKRLASLVIRFDALRVGESVSVSVADQEGAVIQGVATASTVGQTGMSVDFDGDICDWCEVTVTLNGPATTTPTLRSWEVRAYPVAQTTEQWMVPLQIRTANLVGGGQGEEFSLDPLAEMIRIEDLWRSKRAVRYTEGGRTRRVRVDNFQAGEIEWINDGGYFEMTILIQLLSV